MTKARLTKHEMDSATWQKVRAVIEERLKAHRLQVENPERTEAERLGLCHRINELKALLKLEEPPKNTDAGE